MSSRWQYKAIYSVSVNLDSILLETYGQQRGASTPRKHIDCSDTPINHDPSEFLHGAIFCEAVEEVKRASANNSARSLCRVIGSRIWRSCRIGS
jgi:hypothetical protein